MKKNIIGIYGPWLAGLSKGKIPDLSFRNHKFSDIKKWSDNARKKIINLIAQPDLQKKPKPRIERRYEYDGLYIEEISWQLPYGNRTKAVFLKPSGAKSKLPGIVALHDHAAKKFWGKNKIIRVRDPLHPLIKEHQNEFYQGRAWANELARRGYAVLVHDAFLFESRRLHYEQVLDVLTGDKKGKKVRTDKEILDYNEWSRRHEDYIARSLFCSATSWIGLYSLEDKVALDILCSRNDVDPRRVGCGGLSGGGLRTVFLAGLDRRIKACFCAGFMTTWEDMLLNKSYTHTWMTYLPCAPRYMDFPEILAIRAPLPTLVLNCRHDPLLTLRGMRDADKILTQIYEKAKSRERYRCSFYPGGHKFNIAMQEEAFEWLDKWLK